MLLYIREQRIECREIEMNVANDHRVRPRPPNRSIRTRGETLHLGELVPDERNLCCQRRVAPKTSKRMVVRRNECPNRIDPGHRLRRALSERLTPIQPECDRTMRS